MGGDEIELLRKACLLVMALSGLAMMACDGPSGATPGAVVEDRAPLPTLGPAQVARGRQLYVQQCATCHGANAEGAPHWQQPDPAGNLPPPPHDDSGHTWRHPDVQLAEIIRDGFRDRFNKSSDLTMPTFGDKLTAEEIGHLIAYFKSLWSEEHQRFQYEQNFREPIPTVRSAP